MDADSGNSEMSKTQDAAADLAEDGCHEMDGDEEAQMLLVSRCQGGLFHGVLGI